MSLHGKSILVVGGGSGIGRATALLLAEAGCRVTVGDAIESAGEETCAQIRLAGGQSRFAALDVRDEAAVAVTIDEIVGTYGRLDGACHAAGIRQRMKPTHELTLAEFATCLDVNLLGTFLCMKYEIAAMLRTGGGAIVNIASTAGAKGIPMASEYCASKSGVIGMTRGAAIDYGQRGIRINAVLPGGTRTPMLEVVLGIADGLEEQAMAAHPIGRFGQPVEIANAIRWLLSDEASFVTGAAVAVDGGQTAI